MHKKAMHTMILTPVWLLLLSLLSDDSECFLFSTTEASLVGVVSNSSVIVVPDEVSVVAVCDSDSLLPGKSDVH